MLRNFEIKRQTKILLHSFEYQKFVYVILLPRINNNVEKRVNCATNYKYIYIRAKDICCRNIESNDKMDNNK